MEAFAEVEGRVGVGDVECGGLEEVFIELLDEFDELLELVFGG